MIERKISPDLETEQILIDLWRKPITRWLKSEFSDTQIPEAITNLPLCLTNDPESLFGTDPVYHVTSDYCLPSLSIGFPIIPPISHESVGLITHRQAALHLIPPFLKILRINTQAYNSGVFTGHLVDAEQLLLEHRLAQEDQIEAKTLGMFFFLNNYGDYVVQTEWYDVFDQLAKYGHLANAQNTDLSHFLKGKLEQIFKNGLIREGWYQEIEKIFTGQVCLPYFDEEEAIKELYFGLFSWENCLKQSNLFDSQYIGKGQANVLEISPELLYDHFNRKIGGFPLLFSSRDPRTIWYLPYIPPSAITKIYHMNPGEIDYSTSNQLRNLGKTILPITQVPQEAWLAGKTPQNIGDWSNINPHQALCDIRYSQTKSGELSEFWRENFKNGVINPVNNFKLTPTVALEFFGVDARGDLITIEKILATLRAQK